LIAFGLTQFDELQVIGEGAFKMEVFSDAAVELLADAHQRLRFLRVAPQRGILSLGVQLGKFSLCRIEVKDASSAVPATA
jgi:hypothetical protein